MNNDFPKVELDWRARITEVYNTGDCEAALRLADEFLRECPQAPLARYCAAVMRGDFSYDARHSADEAKRLKDAAILGVGSLLRDPEFGNWPIHFRHRVRNEHYFFNGLSREQYDLGLERLALGQEGDYPACVGAAGLAVKSLRAGDVAEAEAWAEISLKHYEAFLMIRSEWYNIRYFAAQALGCLGRADEAAQVHRGMCEMLSKKPSAEDLATFTNEQAEIAKLRVPTSAKS